MKHNRLNNILITLLASGIITACSSGSSSTTSTPQNPTLQGPVNTPQAIQDIDTFYGSNSYNAGKSTTAAMGVIGYISLVGTGSKAFTGSIAVYNQINKWAGNGPVDSLSTINQQLNEMQKTLNSMESTINATNSTLVNFIQLQQANVTNNYFYQLNNINSVVGINSGYGSTFNSAIDNQSIESAANNSTTITKLNSLLITMVNNQYSTNILQNISNNQTITGDETWSYMKVAPKDDPSNSIVALAYRSLYQELQTLIPENVNGSNENFISTINQYNQEVMQVYLNNVLNLQIMYDIETTINYMNYLSPYYSSFTTTILEPSSAIVSHGYNKDQYTQAQANLTALYAQRINAAFNTAMYWTISDPVLNNQKGIIQNGIESYAKFINQNIPAKTLVGTIYATNGSGPNRVPGGSWTESANLYQNPYLGTFYQCQEAMDSNESITQQVCGSLLGNQQNAYYSAEYITAYNANNVLLNSIPVINCYNPTESANYSNLFSFWNDNGSLVLQCNAWQISSYVVNYSSGSNSYLNLQASNSNSTNIGFLPTKPNTSGMFSYTLNNGVWSNGAEQLSKSKSNNFHIYLSTDSIVAESNFELVNGNGNFYQENNPTSLYNSGFDSNIWVQTAGMQVTLPNGFIFPFYIYSFAASTTAPYIQLLCPGVGNANTSTYQTMLIPNLVSCQGSNQDAGIQLQTSDGNTYNITLTANDRQQAYLGVSAN